MTREEIEFAAYYKATEDGMINIAKFFDIVIEGTSKMMIDKACEWLDCYIDNYLFIDAENKAGVRWNDFINDFREAMKGGEG